MTKCNVHTAVRMSRISVRIRPYRVWPYSRAFFKTPSLGPSSASRILNELSDATANAGDSREAITTVILGTSLEYQA